MAREKRKTRLDKSTGTGTAEFIGFAAFGSSTSTVSEGSSTVNDTTATTSTTTTASSWSPVYTGKDETLQTLFPRISQKRDATTKVKALQELQSFFLSSSTSSPSSYDTANTNTKTDRILRRLQVEALNHWAWLFFHKLVYDPAAVVRAESLLVWKQAAHRIPKAVTQQCCSTEPELLGMFFVATADPAAEVRAAARDLMHVLRNLSQQQDGSSSWPWQEGLIRRYATRIFSYGRTSAMQDALFSKKKSGDGSTTPNSSSSKGRSKSKQSDSSLTTTATTEEQKDKAEERYERIVGTCLDALSLWLQLKQQQQSSENAVDVVDDDDDDLSSVDTAVWWKTLPSPKIALRQKTYRLLATACSLSPPSSSDSRSSSNNNNNKRLQLTIPDNMLKSLVQALSTERDATNLPTLLEATVALCARHQRHQKSDKDDSLQVLIKPLTKILKKACYGAQVRLWGSTLLPLTALLVDGQQSNIILVQAAWEGRDLTLGDNDRFQLATAVAECTSFVLLRRQDDENDDGTTEESNLAMAREMTPLWLQTLQFFLSDTDDRRETSPAAKSQKLFAEQLAKNLIQFQEVSPDRAFCTRADWFWSEGLDLSHGDPSALYKLLQSIFRAKRTQTLAIPNRLLPHLQTRFLSLLSTYQTNSGAVPSKENYEFFSIVLESCGPNSIFTEEGSLEHFAMNELLRWIIIHTSRLSTQIQNQWFVQQDFLLLHTCLKALESKRANLWDSLLREVLLAQVDLHWLVVGLKVIEEKSLDDASWITCNSLRGFAIDIADSDSVIVTKGPRHEEGEKESSIHADEAGIMYERRLDFFRICLGTSPGFPSVLVDHDVLTKWADTICQGSNAVDPLLEAVLELLILDRDDLATFETERIILHSWNQGGPLYTKYVPGLLKNKYLNSFLQKASLLLQEQLNDLLTHSEEEIAASIKKWSGRATRFLEACKEAPSSSDFAVPSLRLVGLGDFSRWEKHPHVFYQCILSLLESFNSYTKRLSIIQANGEGPKSLAAILSAIADGASITPQGYDFDHRSDHCERLLATLGGRDIESDFVEATIQYIVTGIEKSKTSVALRRVGDEVAALAQLVETMFLPVLPVLSSDLKPENIGEGDQIWYISDPKEPYKRDHVSVKKIHYDAQSGYYYTILLQRGETVQERQTVLERLRRDKLSVSDVGVEEDQIDIDEQSRRKRVRNLLMDGIVRRFFHPVAPTEYVALLSELVGVIGGVIGLGEERGLGSASYEVFQIIVGIESALTDAMEANEFVNASHLLWSMALALGFGLNAKSRRWSLRRMSFDFVKSSKMILEIYNSEESIGNQPELSRATLAWISSTLEHLLIDADEKEGDENVEVAHKILRLLFRLAIDMLSESLDNAAYISSKAVFEGTRIMSEYSSELSLVEDKELFVESSNVQSDALVCLVARATGGITHEKCHGESIFTALSDIYDLARRDASVKGKLALACRSGNTGAIASSLFNPRRRFLSLRLLEFVAERSSPLQSSDEDVKISTTTESNLPLWLEGLEEEEASQIEEDVYIVAEWVPLSMMEEVERWAHTDYDALDEAQTMGQLLTWLSFLHFVDAAAPSDFRNRPAFISYLGKSDAANHILNLALLNEKTINGGKKTTSSIALLMEDLLIEESLDFELSSIASVVIFRTVEVLPSLSRRWWEEECPKVYTSPVQSLVEKHVSPKILERELERIKNAASVFGEMNVSASSVSREVTAQYVQDDFTLKVLISLPPAFPLRSAEVDCSKTLGVPQKRWKRWSLQIMLMLNNQGGTLKDALMLWKDNVDKEFEGVEPCPVCYSVLHVKTHKLPSLQCKTCNNRFHVECLNQWFRSSGKSQCVLCQQPWQGTRV